MNINAHTELYCIFGKPVRHSLSPFIHNTAFQEMRMNAVYLAFEPSSIKEAVSSMRALNIQGASVTIPFKVEAMDYVDEIDPLASEIGSINTLHNVNGTLKGYNTDGYGALQALVNSGIVITGSHILILGNGGSARSIAFTLLYSGASVFIAGRNKEKIEKLTNELKTRYDAVDCILLNDISENFMGEIDIIINTTPVGMTPDIDVTPFPEEFIREKHTVFDIVYSPDMTLLLQNAGKKGATLVKGLEMLVNQGEKQFEIWTGKKAPAGAIYQALDTKLNGQLVVRKEP
ncbi:MAG: shikimate dehydrogenase [bacterium]|nr:shikimate dehydrogenase [bacterium]